MRDSSFVVGDAEVFDGNGVGTRCCETFAEKRS